MTQSVDVSLNGFPGVVVTASDATIRVNTLNKSVNETVAGVDIIFADTSAIQELSIGSATVALAGVGSVTGAIAITSETTLNDQAQTVVKTKIGYFCNPPSASFLLLGDSPLKIQEIIDKIRLV